MEPVEPNLSKDQEREKEMSDLREVIRAMKWRLSRLEGEKAIMEKTVTNLAVSNRELKRSVFYLKERLGERGPEKSLSVRLPKGS